MNKNQIPTRVVWSTFYPCSLNFLELIWGWWWAWRFQVQHDAPSINTWSFSQTLSASATTSFYRDRSKASKNFNRSRHCSSRAKHYRLLVKPMLTRKSDQSDDGLPISTLWIFTGTISSFGHMLCKYKLNKEDDNRMTPTPIRGLRGTCYWCRA